ncbi:hypothetical protein, partial [Elstera litoralis]|uniref:hypothetical protein n=1 Tax=Elstera litoralis TaxID=552518 RepID=UPI0018DDD4AB
DADREIAKYITLWRKRYPGHQVGIVGHSWGGYCSYQVAQRLAGDGIPLDLLVTLDPVTKRDFERRDGFEITKSNRPFERPRTTERWYNVFVRDDPAMPTCSNVSMGTSNRVARNGGGSWRDLKLRGLVHGEWEITSDIVSNNSPVCHMDNGHELVQKMLTNVHKYIRDLA